MLHVPHETLLTLAITSALAWEIIVRKYVSFSLGAILQMRRPVPPPAPGGEPSVSPGAN